MRHDRATVVAYAKKIIEEYRSDRARGKEGSGEAHEAGGSRTSTPCQHCGNAFTYEDGECAKCGEYTFSVRRFLGDLRVIAYAVVSAYAPSKRLRWRAYLKTMRLVAEDALKTSKRRTEREGAIPVKIRPVAFKGGYWYYDLKIGESGICGQPEYNSAYPKSMLDEQKCRCGFDGIQCPVEDHNKLGAR